MTVRPFTANDIDGAVALQSACFPPPFPTEFHFQVAHFRRHLEVFPRGQFVAVEGNLVIGSVSNCVISEDRWNAHSPWSESVGGPFITEHDPSGTTLYGLDISVHPDWRGKGVGRALYQARFGIVRRLYLARYGTGCRLPGYLEWSRTAENPTVESYASWVVEGGGTDRTLTPLLRYGLRFLGVIHDYMKDEESANAAALLDWQP